MKNNNFLNNFDNPIKNKILNDFMKNLISNKANDHKEILTRLTHFLVVEKDLEAFAKLCNDIFTTGYSKAVYQYKEKIEEKGFTFNITNPQS